MEGLARAVDFALFRPELATALALLDRSRGGRPTYGADAQGALRHILMASLSATGTVALLQLLPQTHIPMPTWRSSCGDSMCAAFLLKGQVVNIEVTGAPSDEDLNIVGANLTAFNAGEVGPAEKKPLAVLIRNDDGTIVAGLAGYTAWGWLYVQWLWVDEGLRGQNKAAALLEAAEKEAAVRNCHGAYIDTFNPTALKVYQRQGYRPFGVLENFPKGRTRTFLAKNL